MQQGTAKMEVKGPVLVLFNKFKSGHRCPLRVMRGIGRRRIFRIDVLRPRKAKFLEVTAHPTFIVLELSRCLWPRTRVFGNVDPFVFPFIEFRKIQVGGEMKFPNKTGSIPGFTKNIPDIHVVALKGDIEIRKPLIFFATDRINVKFTV